MRKICFSSIILAGILFSGCIQKTVKAVKVLDYSTPTIIDEDLDIGLFSPFEVPLVQEREYEFTATTSHKYVKVHFVIPEKGDKWLSLRKLESNIFTQNLTIPKGTERVEIGISDRAHANSSNEVKLYAVYKVIGLDDFKDYVLNEESRREHDAVATTEAGTGLDAYGKIHIDHKYSSKYPTALKRGQTYQFEIGPFDSSYCIFNTVNKDQFSWLPIERNKEKLFKLSYQIPADAEEFRIALSSTSTTFTESLVSFKLEGDIEENQKNVQDGEKIEISSSTMSSLSIPIDDEKLYKLSVDSFGTDYKFCQVDCNNADGENIDFCILDRVNDKYETNCFYVPDGTANINIYLSDEYFYSSNRIASINVDDKKSETPPLKIGKNLRKSDNHRTEKADEELIKELESPECRNAINAARNSTEDNRDASVDALADLCVDYIKKNAEDDFHKIKLVHDAIWYLASYDWDSLNAGDYKPWDYRTVLSRGLCVCAGFSRTFVYFCDRLGMRAINVLGTALDWSKIKTADDIEKQNHAWTMVELDDGWYLFDLTWDCTETKNGKREGEYTCKNFFVAPNEFINLHFPRNPEKQLLDEPYTSERLFDEGMKNRR